MTSPRGLAGALAFLLAVPIAARASEAVRDDALNRLAYGILGQRLERGLGYVFLAWCAAAVWGDGRGLWRMLGLAAVALAVAFSVRDIMLPSLLPFMWLAVQSATRRSTGLTRT